MVLYQLVACDFLASHELTLDVISQITLSGLGQTGLIKLVRLDKIDYISCS